MVFNQPGKTKTLSILSPDLYNPNSSRTGLCNDGLFYFVEVKYEINTRTSEGVI